MRLTLQCTPHQPFRFLFSAASTSLEAFHETEFPGIGNYMPRSMHQRGSDNNYPPVHHESAPFIPLRKNDIVRALSSEHSYLGQLYCIAAECLNDVFGNSALQFTEIINPRRCLEASEKYGPESTILQLLQAIRVCIILTPL